MKDRVYHTEVWERPPGLRKEDVQWVRDTLRKCEIEFRPEGNILGGAWRLTIYRVPLTA